MTFLLDTCAVSELQKGKPDQLVVSFFVAHADPDLFLSVVTMGEIRKGIFRLPEGRKRLGLEAWYGSLVSAYGDRILPIDLAVAEIWGVLSANDSGLAPPDGLIAATALRHGLCLVTRNTRDFDRIPVPLVNPWQAS